MTAKLDQAKDPNASAELLEELSQDPDADVRLAVGRHRNTALHTLVRLSEDGGVRPRDEYEVCSTALENPRLPVKQLIKASYSDNDWHRNCVARNRSTTPEILDRLCRDSDIYVQCFAIEHPNVAVATLIDLASNPDALRSSAIYSLAGQLHTPTDILLRLLRDEADMELVWRLSGNPNATPEILTKLATCTLSDGTRDRICKHPNCPPLVKVWLQGGYGEMTLQEFLEASK